MDFLFLIFKQAPSQYTLFTLLRISVNHLTIIRETYEFTHRNIKASRDIAPYMACNCQIHYWYE
jgi:hypothetical protein